MKKNYSQWKNLHYSWDNLDDFEKRWDGLPGIHTVHFEDAQNPIDIYVNEHVKSSVHQVQPVFFTGAVSQRGDKKGPFFSGLGLTHSRQLPLIAVADPSLDDDPSLSLGWYTGGPEDALVSNLVRLLEAVQRTLAREMIFIGGSGGGFAALNVGRQFSGTYSLLVWNPQTDVYEYAERFVKLFLKSRFNFAHASLARSDWKDFCKIRTDSKISTNVLAVETVLRPRRFVYLQNASDWHREKHLIPLWSLVSTKDIIEGPNLIDSNHIVFVDQFAEGHAPPSAKLIGFLINQLMEESAVVEDLKFEYVDK